MKKIFYLVFVAFAFVFSACNKQEEPTTKLTWFDETDFALKRENPKPSTVFVGQAVKFMAQGADGDSYVFYPGDQGYNYNKRNLSQSSANDTNYVSTNHKGIGMIKVNGEFVSRYGYKYTKPGEYTVYLVGRNVYDNGMTIVEVLDSAKIVVIDTLNALLPPPGQEANYRFVVQKPKNTVVTSEGTTVTILYPDGADMTNVELFLKAHTATIKFDAGTLTFDASRGTYTWKGSLATDRTITVTSLSGDAQNYILTKAPLPPSTDCDLTELVVAGFKGVITGNNITVTVPSELDLTDTTATFKISAGASLLVGSNVQTTNVTTNDFSSGITYIVKAADGTTTKTYTVSFVTIDTKLASFSFEALNPKRIATIDDVTETIAISVINGTDLESIIATFTASSIAKVYIDGTEAVSGVTELDLTNTPVNVEVKVNNNISKTYVLTVTEL